MFFERTKNDLGRSKTNFGASKNSSERSKIEDEGDAPLLVFAYAEDADIIYGTVVVVGEDLLDALQHVETFGDFAKDGVLAVQMGSATGLAIEVLQLGRHRDTMLGHGVEALAYRLQLGRGEGGAPHDVELATTGATLGIDIVALTGHSQRTTTMRMQQVAVAVEELCLNGIAHLAVAQRGPRLCVATVGVATLNHEILDDTMEEQRVVEMFVGQAQEVVAMQRGVVVERQEDVALGRFHQYLLALPHHRHDDGQRKQ